MAALGRKRRTSMSALRQIHFSYFHRPLTDRDFQRGCKYLGPEAVIQLNSKCLL